MGTAVALPTWRPRLTRPRHGPWIVLCSGDPQEAQSRGNLGRALRFGAIDTEITNGSVDAALLVLRFLPPSIREPVGPSCAVSLLFLLRNPHLFPNIVRGSDNHAASTNSLQIDTPPTQISRYGLRCGAVSSGRAAF
jgi:hypothetical protein